LTSTYQGASILQGAMGPGFQLFGHVLWYSKGIQAKYMFQCCRWKSYQGEAPYKPKVLLLACYAIVPPPEGFCEAAMHQIHFFGPRWENLQPSLWIPFSASLSWRFDLRARNFGDHGVTSWVWKWGQEVAIFRQTAANVRGMRILGAQNFTFTPKFFQNGDFYFVFLQDSLELGVMLSPAAGRYCLLSGITRFAVHCSSSFVSAVFTTAEASATACCRTICLPHMICDFVERSIICQARGADSDRAGRGACLHGDGWVARGAVCMRLDWTAQTGGNRSAEPRGTVLAP